MNAVSRTGLVLSDKRIIAAMDRDFTGKYAPAKLDKNGDVKLTNGVADLEYFGNLYVDICDIIKEIGEEITGGVACASPKNISGHNPCDYCSYFPVCRINSSDDDGEE